MSCLVTARVRCIARRLASGLPSSLAARQGCSCLVATGSGDRAPDRAAVLSNAKSALIPVLALWLGFGDASKITLIFLGCLLPVILGAYNGARGSEQVLIWSARSMGASRLQTLWDVMVPSALPELLSGIRIALAYSFILLVSAELVAARTGLGFMIGLLGEGGVYDGMFAMVLTVSALGFAADRLFLVLTRRLLQWQE